MSAARRRRLALAVALVAALTLTALGAWQLERRSWKLALIARVETRLSAPVENIPPPQRWPSLTAAGDEYRRVQAVGTLLHDRETLVQAVTARGAGFWVMTPLRTAAGTVLINRGFVPPERRQPATRLAAQTAGEVTVRGLLRMSEPGGGFLRANDPAAGRWYSRDVAAIAGARGLGGPVAPFFIDADGTANPGGYPIGGLTVVNFRNTHLVYALTWLALAALAAFAALRLLRERER